MYAHGLGVARDDAEATKWYRKAADQGDAFSQFSLGLAYARGLGVTRDYALAHMWLSLAVTGGFEEAKKARDQLASRMTAAELARAQSLAVARKPKE
jgi:TPR repeat protein